MSKDQTCFHLPITIGDFVFYSAGNRFETRKFTQIANDSPWMNKPTGGYWASPVGLPSSWVSWIDRQEKEIGWKYPRPEGGTFFRLSPNARVAFLISPLWYDHYATRFSRAERPSIPLDPTVFDYLDLLATGANPTDFVALDFRAMANCGYDAIYSDPRMLEALGCPAPLHAWDCTTLLVLNPSVMRDVFYSPRPRSQHTKAAEVLFASSPDVARAAAIIHSVATSQHWRTRLYEVMSAVAAWQEGMHNLLSSLEHRHSAEWIDGWRKSIYGGGENVAKGAKSCQR